MGLADEDRRRGGAALYRYEVEVGFPPPTSAAFQAEPQIKEEAVTWLGGARPVRLIDRQGPSVMARDEDGRPAEVDIDLFAERHDDEALDRLVSHPPLPARRQKGPKAGSEAT